MARKLTFGQSWGDVSQTGARFLKIASRFAPGVEPFFCEGREPAGQMQAIRAIRGPCPKLDPPTSINPSGLIDLALSWREIAFFISYSEKTSRRAPPSLSSLR